MNNEDVNSIHFDRKDSSYEKWDGNNSSNEIPLRTTEVYIDNKNLINHLEEYELHITDKNGSTNVAGLYVGDNSSNLLKDVDKYENFSSNSLIYMFQCSECMSALCPYVLAFKIRKEEGRVFWYDFQQEKQKYPYATPPHETSFSWLHKNKKNNHQEQMAIKSTWDYSSLGPFEFNEVSYMQAVNDLREKISLESK